MTLEALEGRRDYWLTRLEMGEWIGRVSISILADMPELGRIAWKAEECRADIEIREDAGEDTLLHEILHLALEGHKTYKRYNPMTERSINRLAAALLA